MKDSQKKDNNIDKPAVSPPKGSIFKGKRYRPHCLMSLSATATAVIHFPDSISIHVTSIICYGLLLPYCHVQCIANECRLLNPLQWEVRGSISNFLLLAVQMKSNTKIKYLVA